MARIRECDDVWERLPFGIVRWGFVAHLELAGYCLQAIGEICFIGLSKGSSLQVEGNFSAVGDGTEEELADLLPKTRGNFVDTGETAKSDSDTS